MKINLVQLKKTPKCCEGMLLLAGNPILSHYQAGHSHVKVVSNLEVTSPSSCLPGKQGCTIEERSSSWDPSQIIQIRSFLSSSAHLGLALSPLKAQCGGSLLQGAESGNSATRQVLLWIQQIAGVSVSSNYSQTVAVNLYYENTSGGLVYKLITIHCHSYSKWRCI